MRRKELLLTSLILLLSCVRAEATTRTVKQAGGGDFTNIQACATAMAAGDICTVFAGTYNEAVSVSAGTVGNYKILQVNPGDTVKVLRFTLGSHTKIIGFTITNPSSPAGGSCFSISGATDTYVINNIITQCGNGTYQASVSGNFVYIQGNTISYASDTPAAPNTSKALLISGDHILVENNTISHNADGMTLFANHTVIRGNTFSDMLQSECGSHSGNCHRDAIESEPTPPSDPASAFNLYEGNTVLRNIGANAHTYLLQADGCGPGVCTHTIIRYNLTAHVGSSASGSGGTGILDDNAGSGSGSNGYTYIKTYNNTWAFIQDVSNGSHDFFSNGSSNGSEINNIHFLGQSATGYDVYSAYNGGQTGFVARGNLAFCSATPCSFSSTYTSGFGTGNATGNPLFLNAAADDYHLLAGSLAIGRGSFLTTATGAGSASTSLTVADASFFYDGFGIVGVQPDWIRIGPITTVQIKSVNYATNVITLANPVSWSSGDAIYLYKDSKGNVVLNGPNPDVGAYQTGGVAQVPVAPPSNLQAIVN